MRRKTKTRSRTKRRLDKRSTKDGKISRGIGTNIVRILLAVVTGLLVNFSFPDYNLWPLAWVAFLPLYFAADSASVRFCLLLGVVAGAWAVILGFWWLIQMLVDFGHLPYFLSVAILVVAAIYLGLSWGLALAVARFLDSTWKLPWILWFTIAFTAIEALYPNLFPFYLGNSQYTCLPVIQICDITGISGLTPVLLLANAGLFRLVQFLRARDKRKLRITVAAAILVVLNIAYGLVRIHQIKAVVKDVQHLRIGVVQPNVGIFEAERKKMPKNEPISRILRWHNLILQWASSDLESARPDLIVWPETAFFPVFSSLASVSDVHAVALAGQNLIVRTTNGWQPDQAKVSNHWTAAISGPEHAAVVAAKGLLYFPGSKDARAVEVPQSFSLRTGDLFCTKVGNEENLVVSQCVWAFVTGDNTLLIYNRNRWNVRTLSELGRIQLIQFTQSGELLVATPKGLYLLTSAKPELISSVTGKTWKAGIRVGNCTVIVASDGTLVSLNRFGQIRQFQGPVTSIKSALYTRQGELLLSTPSEVLSIPNFSLDEQCVLEMSMTNRPKRTVPGDEYAGFEKMCLSKQGVVALGSKNWLWRRIGTSWVREFYPWFSVQSIGCLDYSAYLYYLPPDVLRLYRSAVPLPGVRTYPEAVIGDAAVASGDFNSMLRGFSTPLLAGVMTGELRYPEDPVSLQNIRYNSVVLVDSDGTVLGRYDKQFLLAFGEYLPLGSIFPWLYDLIPQSRRISQGPNVGPVNFHGIKIGVLVCYEDIIAGYVRPLARNSNVLINLTNDAWFGPTKEPLQHFALALFRSVENRRMLIRSTSTGISGAVDPTGRIVKLSRLNERDSFVVSAPLMDVDTVYSEVGDILPYICMIVTIVALLFRYSKRFRKQQ